MHCGQTQPYVSTLSVCLSVLPIRPAAPVAKKSRQDFMKDFEEDDDDDEQRPPADEIAAY